jgi:hypothetical protein
MKNIFKPAGMKNSFVYTRRAKPKKINNYAYGYVFQKNQKLLPDSVKALEMVYYLDGIKGDGTVNSTIEDLLRWDRALYTNKLLPSADRDSLFVTATLSDGRVNNYGFGWMVNTNKDFGKILSHSGGWPGYVTYIERHTDNDKTVIMLQNTERASLPITQIRNILYNKASPAAQPKSIDIILPDNILTEYIGEYELAPEMSITVTKIGSQLKIQLTGQDAFDLFPSAKDKFYLKVVKAEIDFVRDAKGVVNALVLHQAGQDVEGKKIK